MSAAAQVYAQAPTVYVTPAAAAPTAAPQVYSATAPVYVQGGSAAAPVYVQGGSAATPVYVAGGSAAAPVVSAGGSAAAPQFVSGSAAAPVVVADGSAAAPIQVSGSANAPVHVVGGSGAAPVQQIRVGAPIPAPTYYTAGSVEVPVYAPTVSAVNAFTASTAQITTPLPPSVAYPVQGEGFTQEQLKALFPMGAPAVFTQNIAPSVTPTPQVSNPPSGSAQVPSGSAQVPAGTPIASVSSGYVSTSNFQSGVQSSVGQPYTVQGSGTAPVAIVSAPAAGSSVTPGGSVSAPIASAPAQATLPAPADTTVVETTLASESVVDVTQATVSAPGTPAKEKKKKDSKKKKGVKKGRRGVCC